jgi:hypothetical protein
MDSVTVPALALRLFVLNASFPGTADRCAVEVPPPDAGAAAADVLLGAEALELLEAEALPDADAELLVLLLLEPPHPARTNAKPTVSRPIVLAML